MRLLALTTIGAALAAAGAATAPPAAAADIPITCKGKVRATGLSYAVSVRHVGCDAAKQWTRKMRRSDFQPRGWDSCGDSASGGGCAGRRGDSGAEFSFRAVGRA